MRAFRTYPIALLVAVGALLLTACNKAGDSDTVASDALTAPTPDGAELPDAADTVPDDCVIAYADLFAAENAYTNEMALLVSGQSNDPEPTIQALHAMAEAAPPELAIAFQTLANELSAYVIAGSEQGLFEFEGEPSPEQVAAMQQLDSALNVEAVKEAQLSIDEFFTENC